MTAQKIQGVYEFTPYEDASNSSVLVLSPILESLKDNSTVMKADAVLVERAQFFDETSVKQWTGLIIRDKTIHYPNGTVFGKFLKDDYSQLWVRDYSTDTDNVSTWESYYLKIK